MNNLFSVLKTVLKTGYFRIEGKGDVCLHIFDESKFSNSDPNRKTTVNKIFIHDSVATDLQFVIVKPEWAIENYLLSWSTIPNQRQFHSWEKHDL